MRQKQTPRGVTLIEVMVAMGLLALATLALVSANTFAARSSSRSYRHYVASRLAQQRLDALMLGDQKGRLLATAAGKTDPVPDATPLDCQETGAPALLCSGAQPELVGWVDIYGRPCKRTGTDAEGYHPTCQYRRYLRFKQDVSPGTAGDVWHVSIAVSHAESGVCGNPQEGDYQCVVTSAVITR